MYSVYAEQHCARSLTLEHKMYYVHLYVLRIIDKPHGLLVEHIISRLKLHFENFVKSGVSYYAMNE